MLPSGCPSMHNFPVLSMLLLQCVNRNRNAFTKVRGKGREAEEGSVWEIEMKLCGRSCCVFFCFKCALFCSLFCFVFLCYGLNGCSN